MIPFYEVPRDSSDPRFIQSFSLDEPREALAFFSHLGFVVFRDCLTQAECLASVRSLFAQCGFESHNPDSWAHWPAEGMEKYAMPTRAPTFEVPFVMNRQNPRVHRAFSIILGRDDLLSNHDRCCLFRPTRQVPLSGGIRDMPAWKTAHNLHLDMNPWKYADTRNRCQAALDALEYARPRDFIFENNQVTFREDEVPLQGVINLLDNAEEDGGFIVVPGFRNHFREWLQEATTPAAAGEGGAKGYSEEENGHRFPAHDPLQQQAIRVPMRQGSVVIWDQRTPHGSSSNRSGNFRAAQFIRMFPAEISPERAARRARALARELREAGMPMELVTDHGRRVFGL